MKPSVLACGFGPPCCRDTARRETVSPSGTLNCRGGGHTWVGPAAYPPQFCEMHDGREHACVRHAAYSLQLLSKTRSVHIPGTHTLGAQTFAFPIFSGVSGSSELAEKEIQQKVEKVEVESFAPLVVLQVLGESGESCPRHAMSSRRPRRSGGGTLSWVGSGRSSKTAFYECP